MLRFSKLLVNQRFTNVNSLQKLFSSRPKFVDLTKEPEDANQISQLSDSLSSSSEIVTIESFRKNHQINVVPDKSDDINESYDPILRFEDAPFSDKIKMVFKKEGYTTPTPTQSQSWPIILKKKDLISIAKTGSGKTCGFLVPAFHLLSQEPKEKSKKVLKRSTKIIIVAPTRELTLQIAKEAEKFALATGLTTACLYGGVSRDVQINILSRQGADIVVATPGRANDLIEAGYLNLNHCKYFVMDEADRMLDMGFEPQIRSIIENLPSERQNLFFTATWPRSVQALAAEFLKAPVSLQIGDTDRLNANKDITQSFMVVKPFEKDDKIIQLLEKINPDVKKSPQTIPKTIIFRSRKHDCDILCEQLHRLGYSVDSLHGDKSQAFRDRVMQNFRSGNIRILVATDVAARGLDVKDINVVVNFDLPNGVEDYVHRIGRTARGGNKGFSYSFITHADARTGILTDLVDLVKRSGQNVPNELKQLEEEFARQHHSHTGGAMGRRQYSPPARTYNKYGSNSSGTSGFQNKYGNDRPSSNNNNYNNRYDNNRTGSNDSFMNKYNNTGSNGSKSQNEFDEVVDRYGNSGLDYADKYDRKKDSFKKKYDHDE